MDTCTMYEIQTGDGSLCYKKTEQEAIAFCERDPNATYEEIRVNAKRKNRTTKRKGKK